MYGWTGCFDAVYRARNRSNLVKEGWYKVVIYKREGIATTKPSKKFDYLEGIERRSTVLMDVEGREKFGVGDYCLYSTGCTRPGPNP